MSCRQSYANSRCGPARAEGPCAITWPCLSRLLRSLLRRLDRDQRSVLVALHRTTNEPPLPGTIEMRLDAIVQAHAAAAAGDETETRKLARWWLSGKDTPWVAVFYLDTLAEVPFAWQRVCLQYDEPRQQRTDSPLTAFLVSAAEGNASTEVLSLITHFFDRMPRPSRAASPVLAGVMLAGTPLLKPRASSRRLSASPNRRTPFTDWSTP
jgi:hypothetical protein